MKISLTQARGQFMNSGLHLGHTSSDQKNMLRGLIKLTKELLYIAILFGCGFFTGVFFRNQALDQFSKMALYQFLQELPEHLKGAEKARASQADKIKTLQAIEKDLQTR
jgi:hypothetical protein